MKKDPCRTKKWKSLCRIISAMQNLTEYMPRAIRDMDRKNQNLKVLKLPKTCKKKKKKCKKPEKKKVSKIPVPRPPCLVLKQTDRQTDRLILLNP